MSETDLPPDTGKSRIAIVTGASSGIGTATAQGLAERGFGTILAVRDLARGEATRMAILAKTPKANITVARLDLADLSSVRTFAEAIEATGDPVDLLINNAGLGMQAKRFVSADGFERQFATNHLGHFALTGLLMPALLRAAAPRVVTVSSIAHWRGRMDFDDLQGERRYIGGKAYGQSKLSNLMFALELDRRAKAAGTKLVSVAAHPGIARSGFLAAIGLPAYQARIADLVLHLFGQDSEDGAKPSLHAAIAPDVRGGSYWGPNGFMELKGEAAPAKIRAHARDQAAAERLWTISEALTGVTYPF